ncbi:MAG: hypothetical protein K2L29_07335, partial [Duncaniella sp.]|nr:hypothetical protein [Duncaniella sp.]
YYSVKASIGDITSAPSPRVWVDGLTGLKVTTKEGTNVTSDSFTANWEALGHADSYKVEAYAMTHATQDIDEVVILEESFDNINEGTTDVPGTSWDSPFDFSSKGWASTGWSAHTARMGYRYGRNNRYIMVWRSRSDLYSHA